jgi:hypothetical protein
MNSSGESVLNPHEHTCALINSASYQFTVSFLKETNKFTIIGNHWYHDENENILEDVDSAEKVFRFIRRYISTWCHFSIIQYVDFDADSRLGFFQTFTNMDESGITLAQCFDYLRNY